MPRRRSSAASAPRQQTRSSHTMAAPAPTRTAPPPPAPAAAHPSAPVGTQQPGLFAQMASTAAGVAVGSAVGHTLANGVSSLFGGSSSSEVAAAPVQQEQLRQQSVNCEVDARNFTKCMDENGGNMQICDWYLQQLKACQQAASSY